MLKFRIHSGKPCKIVKAGRFGRVRSIPCYVMGNLGALRFLVDPKKRPIVRYVKNGPMYMGFVPKNRSAHAG